MKRSKKIVIILILMFVCLFCVEFNVDALSCKESESDAILNHFGIKSTYDINSKEVTISVQNGEFIVTYFEGADIISNDYRPSKVTETYDGVSFDLYSFPSDKKVLSKSSPIKFKIKSGGVIKLGLAFYKTSNKDKKDSYTGCYSYDYFLKNKDSNSAISTFETKKEEGGKVQYIEIDIPNPAIVELKTNTNKDTFCKAIREGVNYKNKFDSKVMSYWSSDSEAINFYKSLVGDCWSDNVVYVYSEKEIISLIESTIKLWHNSSVSGTTGLGADQPWSIDFNKVKNAAISAGHAYYAEDSSSGSTLYNLVGDKGKGSKISSNVFSLKCNYLGKNLNMYKTDDSGEEIIVDGKPVYNIDANIDNYYAVNVNEQYATYVYNYTGSSSYQNKVTKNVKVCSTVCEEAVEVKYGPPVASKAGLCFEYQVQVTSRVKCESSVNPDGKPDYGTYCSPVPYCNRVPGYVHQGGPVEEYDSCINDCDGGKYTKSCSNKCYKKVYGDSVSGSAKMAVEAIATETLEKLSATGSESFVNVNNGLYIRDRNNNIYWRKNKQGSNAVGYARYYLEGSERVRTLRDHGSYTYDYNGFKRAVYGDTLCGDACYYTGCGKETYLNPGEREKDYAENMSRYNVAIANCKLSASCTEKTAKFKIGVNYDVEEDGSVVTKKINYKDSTLKSDDDSTCSNPTVPAKDNILLNYQGCYKECGNGQQYHARWSFPGTWINLKTGEFSYTSKPENAWYEATEKFCTPRDTVNVNESWWNYYLHNNPKKLAGLSIDPDEYSKLCTKGNGTIGTPLEESKIKVKYNIFAQTRNFGYFGWNFNISCFYALNSCGGVSYTNYKVRSVSTSDMFPDESGKENTNYAETGREPGYNWTEGSVSIVKNPDYIIDPPTYIAKIQKQSMSKKDAVYTKENLDYEFELSPKDLSELRKVKSYTDFSDGIYMKPGTGSHTVQNGVTRYYSNVIDRYANKPYRPSEKAVQCNNIKNLSSGECDDYKGE